ncbi:MAG TPA: hypothetical protein VM778_03010 [Gemmatimonadota bacterium]|nr:hypothetical protein [Gemmatimonadota bacterium]
MPRIDDLLLHLIDTLEDLALPYGLTDSIASMVYGEPRTTFDIDVVVQLQEPDVDRLKERFPEPDFFLDEVAARPAVREGRSFNILHPVSGFKIDVFPAVGSIGRMQIERRRRLPAVGDRLGDFSPPEALIVYKLRYYREGGSERQLRDIASMLAISGDDIDREEIGRLASEFGVDDVWRQVLAALDAAG